MLSKRSDFDDIVFLERKCVVGQIGRTSPDGLLIAHDVFAGHEFHTSNAAPRVTERLHKCGSTGRSGILTGGKIRLKRLIAVVAKRISTSACAFSRNAVAQLSAQRIAEAHVINRKIQSLFCAANERSQSPHHIIEGLFAFSEKEH